GSIRIRCPALATRPRSIDHARLEFLELLFVIGPHPLEQVARRPRFLLVDLRDREPDVDQHPVAGTHRGPVGVEETDVDVALDTGYVHLGEPVLLVHDFDDLPRYGQTHAASSSPQAIAERVVLPPGREPGPTSVMRVTPARRIALPAE